MKGEKVLRFLKRVRIDSDFERMIREHRISGVDIKEAEKIRVVRGVLLLIGCVFLITTLIMTYKVLKTENLAAEDVAKFIMGLFLAIIFLGFYFNDPEPDTP